MTATTRKNITIDDIREALAGDGESEPLNPLNTNAHAIREILGRGSFGTIQKHLETIRNELTDTGDDKQGHSELPKAPDAVIAELWKSACLMAQAKLLERCDMLNSDRDTLRESLELSVSDYQTALEEIEALENTVTQKDIELSDALFANAEIGVIKAQLNEARAQNKTLTELIERTIGASTNKSERKQRTTITDKMTADVLKRIADGEKVDSIAESVGISVGSVNAIKNKNKKQ